MSVMAFIRKGWLIPAVLFLLPLGCSGGKEGSLSGSVTFNGKPVEKGFISFYPTEGQGQTTGGEISKGTYTAKGVSPGKNRVEIAAAVINASSGPQAAPSPDSIPRNATGNNQVIEVKAGKQTLDFKVESPAR